MCIVNVRLSLQQTLSVHAQHAYVRQHSLSLIVVDALQCEP